MNKKKKCILIVEDDPIAVFLQESLIKHLKDIDCVKAFSDGGVALQHLSEAEHPSLVLLDLLMPGIDGFDFLRAFQRMPSSEREKVKIVILSAHLREEDKIKALELGAVDVLEKPTTEEKMKFILEKHF